MKLTENDRQEVLKIIEDYTDAEVTLDTELTANLGLSSFDAVMILEAVNEKLGTAVEASELYGCKTVGELMEKF